MVIHFLNEFTSQVTVIDVVPTFFTAKFLTWPRKFSEREVGCKNQQLEKIMLCGSQLTWLANDTNILFMIAVMIAPAIERTVFQCVNTITVNIVHPDFTCSIIYVYYLKGVGWRDSTLHVSVVLLPTNQTLAISITSTARMVMMVVYHEHASVQF